MGTSKGYVYELVVTLLGADLRLLDLEANILINHDSHACIADFSLIAIIPDQASFISTITRAEGGTLRWMSPELLNPESFGLGNSCPTKESDCYALGMVIYEVLSGQVPFSQCMGHTFLLKVMGGERPEKPRGTQGAWFTDELWGLLERCWRRQPHDRPNLKALLQYLEGVTRPPQSPALAPIMGEDVVTGTNDSQDLAGANLGGFPISSKASGRHSTTPVV